MSYVIARRTQLGSLGLSLKPPKWLRKIINTPVSVPTDTGPISVTPGQIIAASSTGPSPMQQAAGNVGAGVASFVDAVPGGWLTVGGGALLAGWLLFGRGRRHA